MRDAKEFIAELDVEATAHGYVALIVAFETTTIPIDSWDDNRLKVLEEAVSLGGRPIGVLAVDKHGYRTTITSRVFSEYVGRAAVHAGNCLDELAQVLMERLTQRAC